MTHAAVLRTEGIALLVTLVVSTLSTLVLTALVLKRFMRSGSA
jgi:putative effector of murein hydrolase LrgA (UPF0299 family)